jgi:hypothetical protein
MTGSGAAPTEGVADVQTEGGADAPLGVDTSTGERTGAKGETSPS